MNRRKFLLIAAVGMSGCSSLTTKTTSTPVEEEMEMILQNDSADAIEMTATVTQDGETLYDRSVTLEGSDENTYNELVDSFVVNVRAAFEVTAEADGQRSAAVLGPDKHRDIVQVSVDAEGELVIMHGFR